VCPADLLGFDRCSYVSVVLCQSLSKLRLSSLVMVTALVCVNP
jgi:hypothetical protein